ncbi:hypothetical protein DVH24_036280 [Malus domestica]|uniref:Uncharacterized protein n=1 Tax=Malus domestica TaxID=3750 RepID=A0A498IFX0_MALDO|nr:hypothetical protein DVH24_036280 [Malus domestica]
MGKRVEEPQVGVGNLGSGRVRAGSKYYREQTGRAGPCRCYLRGGPIPCKSVQSLSLDSKFQLSNSIIFSTTSLDDPSSLTAVTTDNGTTHPAILLDDIPENPSPRTTYRFSPLRQHHRRLNHHHRRRGRCY